MSRKAIAESSDGLHGEDERGGDDAHRETPRHADTPEHAQKRTCAEHGPDDLPQQERTEQQRRHEDGSDRRVDELEVVAGRAGQVDVVPVDHVLDGEVVDAQVDGVRVVRPHVTLRDHDGQQDERDDQGRRPLGSQPRQTGPEPVEMTSHAVSCCQTESRSVPSRPVRFARPGASSYLGTRWTWKCITSCPDTSPALARTLRPAAPSLSTRSGTQRSTAVRTSPQIDGSSMMLATWRRGTTSV